MRDAKVKESVDDPRRRTDVALVFQGVAFKHGQKSGDGEDGFRHAEAGP